LHIKKEEAMPIEAEIHLLQIEMESAGCMLCRHMIYSATIELMMTRDLIDPEAFLPLPTAVFHILVALADRDRHGYSIMQDVTARTGGKVRLSAGTLYSSIRRMLEQGLVEELRESPDPRSTDERRRYYRLTRWGRRVALAEARRLNDMLSQARETGLIPKKL
jgi:DNA-binding PadR family transcriptional regulator